MLRTELGLCHAQMKNIPGVIEAFTYYVQAFPDDPQAPAALDSASLRPTNKTKLRAPRWRISNTILTKYPKAHEREAAFAVKSFDPRTAGKTTKGMVDTFRHAPERIPQEFCCGAGCAIGKAAFEAKDYKTALTALNAARQLEQEQYYNLASLRIMLSQFYLKDRAALTKEVNSFMSNSPRHKCATWKFWSGSGSDIITRKISRLRKNA